MNVLLLLLPSLTTGRFVVDFVPSGSVRFDGIGLLLFLLLPSLTTGRFIVDFALPGSVRFDGIGAISGGGGETVLLPSYPAAQRAQVLDYLLRPSFGASLHILKVEIGGDALSTDGAEPSHMHTEEETPNFTRGYEWWLMKEAKARNPHIKLYALPWEFPAWVGAGNTSSPYRNLSKPLHYVTQWMKGARDVHRLEINYVGIWNECECRANYVVALRHALDACGFNATLIIAPDGAIDPSARLIKAMAVNSTLADAVHAIGYHYPDSGKKVPTQDVLALLRDTPQWASEDDSTVDPPPSKKSTDPRKQPGGGCLVRTLNENWVRGNISATIVWNLVMARYPQLRWDYTGLIAATDPFAGHFDVLPSVWAAAHTTQFTAPGWRLTRVGYGSGYLANGGTYVTYVKNDVNSNNVNVSSAPLDVTIVIEKMDRNQSLCERGSRPSDRIAVTTAETATFALLQTDGKSLPTTLAVWSSFFGGVEPDAGLFTKMPDVPVVNGEVTIRLLPNHAYTLSTVRTASKGEGGAVNVIPPPMGSFPSDYTDSFDACVVSSIPKYIAPMAGAFECVAGRSGGRTVMQAAPAKSICNRGDVTPYVILGDGFRTTYDVSIDVLLPTAKASGGSGAFVGARCKGPVGSAIHSSAPGPAMDGVFFAVNRTTWIIALQVGATNGRGKVVASGEVVVPAVVGSAGDWMTLALSVAGTTASASINGKMVVSKLKVPAPYDHFTGDVGGITINLGSGGYASFGTVGYIAAEFDNLHVTSN